MQPVRSTYQRIASNAGILATGNAGAVLCNYLAVACLARRLDKEMFGLFMYGQTLAAYAILGADLGFSPYFSRTVAKEPQFVERNLVSIVATQVGAAIVCTLLILLFSTATAPLGSANVVTELAVAVSLSAAIVSPFAIDWYYLGTNRIATFSISKLIQAVTFLAVATLAVTSRRNVILACSLRTVSLAIAAAWLASRLPSSICLKRSIALAATYRIFRNSAKWFWMSAVFVQLYNGIDIVILHSLGKTAELGLYSAAFRLNALLVTGVSLMNSAMLPVLASESLATPRRFRGVMTQYTFVASALAAILVALAIFGSNILVTLAYGNGYLQAGQYARLLLLGAAALAINGAVAQPLLATGRERAVTLQVAATAIVCGVANLLLIPKFGAIAAAWVYLSAAVFGTVCLLPAYWNLLRGGPAAVVSRLQPSPCEVEELA